MKNRNKFLMLLMIFGAVLFGVHNVASAETKYGFIDQIDSYAAQARAAGYTCVGTLATEAEYWGGEWPGTWASYRGRYSSYSCTQTVITSSFTTYGATPRDYRTLVGTSNTINNTSTSALAIIAESPFIYLQNPPAGDISLSLSSQFNKYYPKPAFNQNNGWLLNSKDGKISLNGEEKNNLFYELEINKLTLNRNGKNFSSKAELSNYLQSSDFLTKLGFTEEQKKNSLDYLIPKLNATANKNFYYLNILSDNAVNEISKLNITPTPENLARLYFAVYPTNVEVKTANEFIFPEQQSSLTAFTATETGEFLVQPAMQVFFE